MKPTPALLLALLTLTGCGGEAVPAAATGPPDRKIVADADAVRAAATRGDRSGAEAALATLTRDVAAAQAAGHLDGGRAQTILTAADRVTEDVRTLPVPVPPPAPAPPPSTVTVSAPPPPQPTTSQPKPARGGDHRHRHRGGG